LICDEGQKFSRRHFISFQCLAGVPEVAEQHANPKRL
jgi:hypothetical protein